ncbi:short chain dehydrogenase [Corynespora cassiicola Philippines]|uniref:Short chain dehydrogenase n=1 Tax=Corynespora cassiicola Philippines TaxID=1448308 RepID=A0A2T2N800_CORCC|nr:short chain dehydrogenase [Corynespora cassiicola Philippines]
MSNSPVDFLRSQLIARLPYPADSYTGKTIVVTGSNVGLGKEAARHFVRLGASMVILAVRSLEKGDAAKKDIEHTTGVRNVIQVWKLDMANYHSVQDFAAKVAKELPRVDIALLNAGVARGTYELFENHEATITVNVISTMLLALLLLPKLKESAETFKIRPNVTIVASGVHAFAKFEEKDAPLGDLFDRLRQALRPEDMEERYEVSKLLIIFCIRALCERRPASQIPVIINYVCPGLCKSSLSREADWSVVIQQTLFARSTECGSRTLVHAASQGPETHGQFMADCQVSNPSPYVLSKEGYTMQNRVWEELGAELELIQPGIMKNL